MRPSGAILRERGEDLRRHGTHHRHWGRKTSPSCATNLDLLGGLDQSTFNLFGVLNLHLTEWYPSPDSKRSPRRLKKIADGMSHPPSPTRPIK